MVNGQVQGDADRFIKAEGTLTIGAPGIKVPQVAWVLDASPLAGH
jgi:hypothetical protein